MGERLPRRTTPNSAPKASSAGFADFFPKPEHPPLIREKNLRLLRQEMQHWMIEEHNDFQAAYKKAFIFGSGWKEGIMDPTDLGAYGQVIQDMYGIEYRPQDENERRAA
jgi:hypothetical protein